MHCGIMWHNVLHSFTDYTTVTERVPRRIKGWFKLLPCNVTTPYKQEAGCIYVAGARNAIKHFGYHGT